MIKLLDISPRKIIPSMTGGQIRIFELLKNLSKLNIDVNLFSHIYLFDKKITSRCVNPNFKITETRNYLLFLKIFTKLKIFPSTWYMTLPKYSKSFYKKYFKDYDVYQFEFPWLSSWYDLVPKNKPIIYASHNVELIWFDYEIKRCLFSNYFYKKLFQLEKSALKRCNKIIACSEEDKINFVKIFGIEKEKIAVVPNGFDSDKFKLCRNKDLFKKKIGFCKRDKVVLFCASDVIYNEVAFNLIIKRILPLVTKKKYKILIIGGVGEKYKNLNNERLRILGRVKDILPYFYASDIAVNPVVSGSGSNIKIPEYLASGLPVISTEFGMRGYNDLKKFVTICEIDDFAKNIKNEDNYYLNDQVFNILERYKWSNLAKKLKSIYEEFI